MEALDQRPALRRVARRAHHLAALAVEQQLEALPKGLMILDEH
jgi:hypothetical protein